MTKKVKKITVLRNSSTRRIASGPAAEYQVSSMDIFFAKVFNLIGILFPPGFIQHQEADWIPIIRTGLSKKNLYHLVETTGLDISAMAGILHISERTLHRYTPETVLNAEISERIIEVARLYAKGEDVFGSLPYFKTWMYYPSKGLGSKTPREYLDTSLGIKLVEDELGRIEHGVYG